MDCPKCGYEMSPFDTECPRCKRMAAEAKAATPAAVPGPNGTAAAPMQLSHHGRTTSLYGAAAGGSMALSAMAMIGSTMAGTGTGNLFGRMLQVCLGGG